MIVVTAHSIACECCLRVCVSVHAAKILTTPKYTYTQLGPRNGPPPNYWRQSMDERAFKNDMNIVDSILLASAVDQYAAKQIGEREQQNVAKPSINRKILGRWAPITRRSTSIAEAGVESKESTILVAYTIEIFRSAGRKLGPKNHYGQFDAHLEQGEMLTVRAAGESVYFLSKQLEAHTDNEIVHLADG